MHVILQITTTSSRWQKVCFKVEQDIIPQKGEEVQLYSSLNLGANDIER